MFDLKQAGRLLAQDWKSPRELARELYSMATSREPRKVESPVTISVPAGRTALRLARSDAPSRARLVAEGRVQPQPRPKPAPPRYVPTIPSPRPTLEVLAPVAATAYRLGEALLSLPAPATPHLGKPVASTPQAPAPEPPRRPEVVAAPVAVPKAGVQLGPASEAGFAGAQAPPVPTYARPYVAPIFEVQDSVRIEPGQPVQFDENPVLLNRKTGEYEKLHIVPEFAEVPRETPVEFWWGRVTSKGTTDNSPGGDGLQQYNADIFRYPGAPAKWDNVVVRIYVLDPADTLPATYPLWPIWLCPINGIYYAQPPLFY